VIFEKATLKSAFIAFAFILFLNFSLSAVENAPEQKKVLLAILARNKAHVLSVFLKCIENLDYDKQLITIYINTNNNQDATQEILVNWAEQCKDQYNKIILDIHEVEGASSTRPHEWTYDRFKLLGNIRNKSLQMTKENMCDYYFVVDCDNFISSCTLKELIIKDKPIIAPMLLSIPEYKDRYSNFFCDITETGYYKDHPDYLTILYRTMQGTFKVPVVHCTYLINADCIDKLTYVDETNDYEFVIFSRSARDHNVDQYICNEKQFGVQLHFHHDLTLKQEVKRFKKILPLIYLHLPDLVSNCINS